LLIYKKKNITTDHLFKVDFGVCYSFSKFVKKIPTE